MFSCWLYCCVSLRACVSLCDCMPVCVSTAWQSICLQESSFLFSPSHLCHRRNTQPGLTSAHTHTHIRAQSHKYTHVCILSVCLSVCLFADTHLSVCLSFRTHPHKAHQSQSSAFLLSHCLPVCLPIYLSVIQTVTNDGVGCGGVSQAPFGIPQLKLNKVLNGRDTKWLQQSS